MDGFPRSGQRAPEDPGIEVYCKKPKDPIHKIMTVDQYRKVKDNSAAMAATMRAIERHVGAVILD
ncbi:MAG: hypothetical protein KC643_15770 [Nitrospira sp.]|nr:hypothetical protein [Nitrospira sp.]